jgi:hypothetical protein
MADVGNERLVRFIRRQSRASLLWAIAMETAFAGIRGTAWDCCESE